MRARVVIAVFALGAIVGACDGTDGQAGLPSWSIALSGDIDADSIARVIFEIRSGGCGSSDKVYAYETDDVTARPVGVPALDPGPYGFQTTLIDDSCVPISTGCTERVVSGAVTVRQSLRATNEPALCTPSLCTEGQCIDRMDPSPLCTNPPCVEGLVFNATSYQGGIGKPYSREDRGIGGARIEVYDEEGGFVGTGTTEDSGRYAVAVPPDGTYTVRVVSASLSTSGALPEQLFESNGVEGNGARWAFGGNAVGVSDADTAEEAGVGDTNVSVKMGGRSIYGVDFGFSFNLIVHTGPSGQGSFRQFIINANALEGPNRSIFAIPDGNFLGLPPDPRFTSYAAIDMTASLPTVTGPGTVIDGSTQTIHVGDTNGEDGDDPGYEIAFVSQSADALVSILPAYATLAVNCASGCEVKNIAARSTAISIAGAGTTVESCVLSGLNVDGKDHLFRDVIAYEPGGTIALSGQSVMLEDSLFVGPSGGLAHTLRVQSCEDCGVTGSTFRPATDNTNAMRIKIDRSSNFRLEDNTLTRPNGDAVTWDNRSSGTALGNVITELQGRAFLLEPDAVVELRENTITGRDGSGLSIDVNADGLPTSTNRPALTSVTIENGSLRITGSAQPGSILEFFDGDDGATPARASRFLGSAVEGSSADKDFVPGAFTILLDGVEDLPLSLTSTATTGAQGERTTSEFSIPCGVPSANCPQQ
ncbi:MAG: right-handed parallel beta-helix repeat-containing protein [Myxococcales bacterium]|nr:right-handed parallel beta-helix repeat-containing protein [Myxococcales bacterium]